MMFVARWHGCGRWGDAKQPSQEGKRTRGCINGSIVGARSNVGTGASNRAMCSTDNQYAIGAIHRNTCCHVCHLLYVLGGRCANCSTIGQSTCCTTSMHNILNLWQIFPGCIVKLLHCCIWLVGVSIAWSGIIEDTHPSWYILIKHSRLGNTIYICTFFIVPVEARLQSIATDCNIGWSGLEKKSVYKPMRGQIYCTLVHLLQILLRSLALLIVWRGSPLRCSKAPLIVASLKPPWYSEWCMWR